MGSKIIKIALLCLLPFIGYGQIGYRKSDTALVVTEGGQIQKFKTWNYLKNALNTKSSKGSNIFTDNQAIAKSSTYGTSLNIINPVGTDSSNHIFIGSMGSVAAGIDIWKNKSIIESGKGLVIGSYGNIDFTNGGSRTPVARIDSIGNFTGGTSGGSYLARKDKGQSVYLIGDSFIGLDVYLTTIEEKLGIEITHIDGLGGSCIASGKEDAEADGITRPSYVSRIGLAVASDADIILIETGGNDFHYNVPLGTYGSVDNNTFYGALENMLSAAASSGKRVKITTPILRTDAQKPYALGGAQNWGYILKYVEAIHRVAAKYSIVVIDEFFGSGINVNNIGQYTIDGIHPSTAKGKKAYGDYMVDSWNRAPVMVPDLQTVTTANNKTTNAIILTGLETPTGLGVRALVMGFDHASDLSLISSYDYVNSVAKDILINPSGGRVSIGTTQRTSVLQVSGIVEYADNAAAIAGGLTAGAFYRTGDLLKVVH